MLSRSTTEAFQQLSSALAAAADCHRLLEQVAGSAVSRVLEHCVGAGSVLRTSMQQWFSSLRDGLLRPPPPTDVDAMDRRITSAKVYQDMGLDGERAFNVSTAELQALLREAIEKGSVAVQ